MVMCASIVLLLVCWSFFSSAVRARPKEDDVYKRLLEQASAKRSAGLMRDLVNLLLEEKREREIIMEEDKKTKETLKTLQQTIAELRKKSSRKYASFQDQLDIMKNKTGNHNGGTQKEMIGFTAILRGSAIRSSGLLKFDKIISNYGNGYDAATGKFTCSTPGMYAFGFTISSTTKEAYAWIRKNNTPIQHAYTSHDNNKDWDSGSVSVILKLVVGDVVWVKGGGNYYYGGATSFSGALISV